MEIADRTTVARSAGEAAMLADYVPIPTLAVSDLPRARAFYEEVLGFTPRGEGGDGIMYAAGAGLFLVYESAYAGTNKATAASFLVPPESFDAEVDALRAKGLTFDTFEMEGVAWDAGVASWGDTRGVWFTDPDGNILNVETGLPA